MKQILLTFASPSFYVSARKLQKSTKKYTNADYKFFSVKDFKKTSFYKKHKAITYQARGAGYWLWKPYYILETLKTLEDGDILIYCDSGVDIIAPLNPLIDIALKSYKGILLFENYQAASYFPQTTDLEASEYNLYIEVNKNKYWSKRDAFVLMNLDSDKYWNSPQVDANFQIYRKCEQSILFVEEWLNYCCNEKIITDSPNSCGLPNFHNLFAHIHDQAIISLLAAKHSLELFRCASQFGNHYKKEKYKMPKEFLLLPYRSHPANNSDYGTLLLHHRTKHMPWLFRIKTFLKQEIQILIASLQTRDLF